MGIRTPRRHREVAPPTVLTDDERHIRQAEKGGIRAKYGFDAWMQAPVEALSEYQRFIAGRSR